MKLVSESESLEERRSCEDPEETQLSLALSVLFVGLQENVILVSVRRVVTELLLAR